MGFSSTALSSLRYNNSLRRGINRGYFKNSSSTKSLNPKGKKLQIDTTKADKTRRNHILKSVIVPLIIIFLICIIASDLIIDPNIS